MTPLFLRGRRKSGAVGFVLRSLAGEARGGTRLQIRLCALQTLANGLAEVGRDRETGDTLRAFITGGDLERLRNPLSGYGRHHAWNAGTAEADVRLARDKNRYHGYPECCAQDHQLHYLRQTQEVV